jgi:hypothetical protein
VDGWQRNVDASADAANEPRETAFAAAPIKWLSVQKIFAILALTSKRCQPPIPDRIDPTFVTGSMFAPTR